MKLSERMTRKAGISESCGWTEIVCHWADEVAHLEAENELLWMYYKANKESDYDSFQEAEKRIEALRGE